jgi:hypothetical protein
VTPTLSGIQLGEWLKLTMGKKKKKEGKKEKAES